jgi:hypothetical protein
MQCGIVMTMLKKSKPLRIYAWFWSIITVADIIYVAILNIAHPPSGPEANITSGFLLFGSLVLVLMLTIAVAAIRTTKRWLQFVTAILLGLNPVMLLLPVTNSILATYVLIPLNFLAMCFVLYSLIRDKTSSSTPVPPAKSGRFTN